MIKEIRKVSKQIVSKEEKAQVATISAQDERIGKLIAEAMEAVGNDGVITVEEGKGFDIELVEKAAVIGEKISFYKESLEFSEEEINEIFEVKPSDGLGKHLLLEQEGIRVRYNIP